jgi:hypothetical protein
VTQTLQKPDSQNLKVEKRQSKQTKSTKQPLSQELKVQATKEANESLEFTVLGKSKRRQRSPVEKVKTTMKEERGRSAEKQSKKTAKRCTKSMFTNKYITLT